MKKKLFAVLLSGCMMLSLASCAAEEVEVKEEGEAGVAVHVLEITADTIFTEHTTVGKLSAGNEEMIMAFRKEYCDEPWSDTSVWDGEWSNDREWS